MKKALLFSVLMGLSFGARAADITVTKTGGTAKSALDLSGLKGSGGSFTLFAQTLENDLRRSGWFTIAAPGRGGIVVQGLCSESGGALVVPCDVRNAGAAQSYFSKTYRAEGAQARRLAHQVADDILKALKGVRGIASTRIALVGMRGGRKDLYICDADGGNLSQVTRDGVPCLGPAWGPDGNSIVYTSFRSGYPDIYRIDLNTMRRSRIAGFPGLNMAGKISPSGGSLAAVLSKDGNPEIYAMNVMGGSLTRLTRTPHAAEASPAWSPDGSRMVFVSDRAGRPQLYVASASGGAMALLTTQGSENVAPDWGTDGRIAYCSKRGAYQIWVADPSGGGSKPVPHDACDHEDPSWAPDNRHIVCTRTAGYRKRLYVLDTEGEPEVALTLPEGDWYSAAWSPK